MLHVPEAEVEPWPLVNCADCFEPVETVDCAFEPNGGRVQRPDGGKCTSRTGESEHGNLAGRLCHDRHVDRWRGAGITPEPEQCRAAGGECAGDMAPAVRSHDDARPGAMAVHAVPVRDDVGQ